MCRRANLITARARLHWSTTRSHTSCRAVSNHVYGSDSTAGRPINCRVAYPAGHGRSVLRELSSPVPQFGLERACKEHGKAPHVRLYHGCSATRSFGSAATSRLTWKKHVGELRAAIRAADFVALDVEYTGLHLRDDRYIGLDKCYEAHAAGAKQFVPCQLGLTAAKYLGEGKWRITPASVYTIPSQNKFFKVSTSTLQFLKDSNFDFYSWIHHGVEHLTPAEERERKAAIEMRIDELKQLSASTASTKPAEPVEFDLSSLTPEDRAVAEDVVARVRRWIGDATEDALEIELDNAFQRLLMHTIIGQQFPEVYSHSARRGADKVICVYKSQSDLQKQQLLALEGELSKIDEEIGVRLLLDDISSSGKVLVGHNCFYDILHVYQTFFDELPESVEQFRVRWTDRFRNTLDTKYIAETQDATVASQYSATLKGLFDHMCNVEAPRNSKLRFDVQPLSGTSWRLPSAMLPLVSKVGGESSSGTAGVAGAVGANSTPGTGGPAAEQSHDAGYDSLMTCVVFILQVNNMLRAKHLSWQRLATNGAEGGGLSTQHLLETLGPANNCVRLVKSQPNMINLAGSGDSDMSRYFHMSGYPNSWRRWDIMKVWSPLWVSVSVIDESSCWVIVKSEEDVRNISLIYRMMKNPQFTLQTYDQSKLRAPPAAAHK